MKIEFDNFVIRELEMLDAEGFCAFILNNFDRVKTAAPLTAIIIKDVETTIQFIINRKEQAEQKTMFTYILFDKQTNLPIASLIIKSIDWTIPKGEIGYYIDEHYEGKGIITEYVKQVSNYLFTEMNFNKLYMRIREENVGSKRVAEKNGFVVEGLFKNDYRMFDDSLVDVIYYAKCKI